MSRVGKKPIILPKGVTVELKENTIKVKGPKGQLSLSFNPIIKVKIEDEQIIAERPDDTRANKTIHGTTRANINNLVVGVTDGFIKVLDLVGVGYKFEQKGENVLLTIGYSHPIYFIPPAEIKIEVPGPNQVKISGIDKQLVGLVSAKIRSLRLPEPYKGKGIKYSNEIIIRKAGKAGGK